MFPQSRTWTRTRRALALVPLLAALIPAHPARPGWHAKPVPPKACLEAASLDFGSVSVGARSRLSLQVKNRCAQAFLISKAISDNKAFSSPLAGPVRIPPRGTGAIPVSFAPRDTGLKKTTFTLFVRHPAERIYARVTGRGTAPPPSAPIAVSPASVRLALGPAETDTFRISVTNHGTSPRAEILADAVGDPAPRPERGWRVLYLNTYVDGPWDDELTALLRPLPSIDTVESWYGADSLPGLPRLQEYDVVMVASSRPWKDPIAAGNLLADYLEAGGKVLLTAGSLAGSASEYPSLGGRISDYAPIGKADWTYSRPVADPATHPITEGVDQFQSASVLNVASTRGQGAGISLGTYEDGILIGAYHPDKPLVFLNIAHFGLSGDIPRLLANAFDYLGGMMAWMTPRPPFDPVVFVVPQGETRELKVAVNTHRLTAGNHAGAIRLLNASDTDAVPLDVPVALSVSSRRRLAVDPAAFDFGPTWQGARAARSVRLVNTGNTPTRVSGFVSDGPAFSLAADFPLEIPAFSCALVPAAFAPMALGEDSADVVMRSDAQEAAPHLGLKGKGIAPPILSISPRGFDVSLPAGGSADEILTIRNPGGDSLRLSLRAVVDSAAGIHPTGPERMKVLYLQTTGQSFDSPSDFFLWDLIGDPRIDTLVNFSGFDSTPEAGYLRRFDAVIAVAGGAWADSETVGNRLADYVDAGGKVILMGQVLYPEAGVNPHSPSLGGRIVSPEYSPVAPAGAVIENFAEQFADDPIMEGITSDLWSWWAMNATATQGGGIPLGRYSTGALIGAYNPRKPVVFLNVDPHDGDHYPPQTVLLIGNALRHLGEFYDWLRPARRALALGPGEEIGMPIRFGASYPLPAGTYSGRLDLFHNAPATANPLAVPAKLTVEPAGTASIP